MVGERVEEGSRVRKCNIGPKLSHRRIETKVSRLLDVTPTTEYILARSFFVGLAVTSLVSGEGAAVTAVSAAK